MTGCIAQRAAHFRKIKRRLGGALACILVPLLGALSPAAAQDIIEVHTPWNPVTHPASIGDVLDDCANNHACTAAVDIIGASAGLPPGTITGSVKTFSSLGGKFSSGRQGEEFRTYVYAPAGYRICDVKTSRISAAPMNDNRSPTFAATVQNDNLFELYSFVHVQSLGAGRSWVDTVATVKFAKRGSAAEAGCHVQSGGGYQYRCNQRRYQGMPMCSHINYGTIPRIR